MEDRQSRNLFGHRSKSWWLFLITLLVVPLMSPIGAPSAIAATDLVQQQKKSITGIVVDYTGEPVIGANVVVKDT